MRIHLFADYGVESYDIGSGFGHFGIAVEDVRIYLCICSFSVVEIQYYASQCYLVISAFCS